MNNTRTNAPATRLFSQFGQMYYSIRDQLYSNYHRLFEYRHLAFNVSRKVKKGRYVFSILSNPERQKNSQIDPFLTVL